MLIGYLPPPPAGGPPPPPLGLGLARLTFMRLWAPLDLNKQIRSWNELSFDLPAVKLLIVEILYGAFSLLLGAVGHEPESTRTASITVTHYNRLYVIQYLDSHAVRHPE